MKLVLFFGLMLFCLIVSLILGFVWMRRLNNIWLSYLYVISINAIILGLGSVWWFMTEVDGVSQGLGVIYYGIAFVVISVIDLMVLFAIKKSTANAMH